MVAEFDDGDGIKNPCRVEDEVSMLERVNVTLDEQKIRTTLYGQETATRDVDTVPCILGVSCDCYSDRRARTFEVLDRSSGSRL